MATSTEVAIATQTLGSAASTITFSSIPSTYTDLRLVLIVSDGSNGSRINCNFNSDTGNTYSMTNIQGTGASALSSRGTSQTYLNAGNCTASTNKAFTTIDIFSYTGSTYKTCLTTNSRDDNGSGAVMRFVNLWQSTSAINRIDLTLATTGNFDAGSTATLYGIL